MDQNDRKLLLDIHMAIVGDEYRKGINHRLDRLESESFWHKIAISFGAIVSVFVGWLIGK